MSIKTSTPKTRRGASLLSYGLVVGLISVVALGVVTSVGDSINSLFSETSDSLEGVTSVAATPTPPVGGTGQNCLEILNAGGSIGNGSYTIDPDGGGSLSSISADCDMDNGGITMLTGTDPSWGSLGSVFVIFADRNTPVQPDTAMWDDACAFYGRVRTMAAVHPGTGNGYANTNHASYQPAEDFTTNVISTYSSTTLKSDLVVMHGTTANCWAHENDSGSMDAFDLSANSTNSSPYAWCRGGNTQSKRYHIYMCAP